MDKKRTRKIIYKSVLTRGKIMYFKFEKIIQNEVQKVKIKALSMIYPFNNS